MTADVNIAILHGLDGRHLNFVPGPKWVDLSSLDYDVILAILQSSLVGHVIHYGSFAFGSLLHIHAYR